MANPPPTRYVTLDNQPPNGGMRPGSLFWGIPVRTSDSNPAPTATANTTNSAPANPPTPANVSVVIVQPVQALGPNAAPPLPPAAPQGSHVTSSHPGPYH